MNISAADSFYCIMDHSGNYYRVDSNNRLVAAANEAEAGVFSFAEADRRIGTGQKSRFYLMTPVNDSIALNDKIEFNKENESPDSCDVSGEVNLGNTDETISPVREITDSEITEEIEKSISEYDLSKIDWQEYLTHFTFITSGLREYRDSLIRAESDADQKICDVLHYIELCNTDESEAADLVELLKVCRENRRDIKDEIYRVEIFQKNIGTSANTAKAKEAIKAIKSLETRKYTPRKLTELFDGSEIKTGRTNRKSRTDFFEEQANTENEQDCVEKYTMDSDYERRETPFDGKKNDWMSFAVQQAKFYRNADQYIINLRIDIDEIDGMLAKLMDKIETATCNVTQGYKMFRQLKELRIERRKKEKELECLYILTEHFDLNVMADECDSNVDAMGSFLYGDSENTDSAAEKITVEEEENHEAAEAVYEEENRNTESADAVASVNPAV